MMQHCGIECACSLVRLLINIPLWPFIFILSTTVMQMKSPTMWAECSFIYWLSESTENL